MRIYDSDDLRDVEYIGVCSPSLIFAYRKAHMWNEKNDFLALHAWTKARFDIASGELLAVAVAVEQVNGTGDTNVGPFGLGRLPRSKHFRGGGLR